MTFHQFEELVRAHRIELAIVDTIADTFLGNENIRPQVRAYVNALRRFSLVNDGGTIITAHPSRAGLTDGTGLSGSTGWHGSVRARIYLSKPKSPDQDIAGEDEPTSERVLKTMKSNYGAAGDKHRLKWNEGVFVRTDIAGASLNIYDKLDDDRRLLDAAAYLVKNGERLAATHRHRNSLVNLARELPTCKGISWKSAAVAQDRLLEKGRLVRVEIGPKSRRYLYVRPAHLRYPGEDGGETASASHLGGDTPHDGAINGHAP
jgi:RecA-family ATPase